MKVLIPSPLLSYTRARQVEADGATLGAVLAELDRRYPGLRFRMIDEQDGIRPHVRFFINGEQALDLARPLRPGDALYIVQALSGGRRGARPPARQPLPSRPGKPFLAPPIHPPP